MVNQENRIWKLVLTNIFFFLLVFGIPMFIGIPLGDMFKSFTSDIYSLYAILTLCSLFIIDILYIYEVFIKEKDSEFGDGLLFVSQGEKPATNLFANITNTKLMLWSLIIMSFISVVLFYFTGSVGDKITQSESPLINLFLILFENLFLAVFVAITIFVLRNRARKNKWSFDRFRNLSWISIIAVSVLFGVVEHIFSKSASVSFQGDIIYTAMFWGMIGLSQLIFGSIFFGLGIHFIIDLPFYLNLLMTDKFVLITFALIVLISSFLLFKVRNGVNPALEKKDNLGIIKI